MGPEDAVAGPTVWISAKYVEAESHVKGGMLTHGQGWVRGCYH